jgi:SpoVK/Ycf46/Vps4 family AAA+-type ATPase
MTQEQRTAEQAAREHVDAIKAALVRLGAKIERRESMLVELMEEDTTNEPAVDWGDVGDLAYTRQYMEEALRQLA